jgi:hypothetical protein
LKAASWLIVNNNSSGITHDLRILLLLLLGSDHIITPDGETVHGIGESLNVELIVQSRFEVILKLPS